MKNKRIRIERGVVHVPANANGLDGEADHISVRRRMAGPVPGEKSLQAEFLGRLMLVLQRKRVNYDTEAAQRFREIVQGTADNIYQKASPDGGAAPFGEVVCAWVDVACRRITELAETLAKRARRSGAVVTAAIIEEVRNMFCPVQPVC